MPGPTKRPETNPGATRTVIVEEAVLGKNARLAEEHRRMFLRRGILAVNLLSSPGSGKTALLERTLAELRPSTRMAVVVGDLETDNDARRLRDRGASVVQVVTGSVCHLESEMVSRAMAGIDLGGLDILFIENVGNLVCPAAYDLGEGLRVALLSVTEGEDKPLKYPVLFHSAHAVIVNKVDIADAVGFDRARALESIRSAAPHAAVIELSARTGQGMDGWYRLLAERLARQRDETPAEGTAS